MYLPLHQRTAAELLIHDVSFALANCTGRAGILLTVNQSYYSFNFIPIAMNTSWESANSQSKEYDPWKQKQSTQVQSEFFETITCVWTDPQHSGSSAEPIPICECFNAESCFLCLACSAHFLVSSLDLYKS